MGIGTAPRLVLFTIALGAGCLIVASACTSSTSSTNETDAGTPAVGDAGDSTVDGSRKDNDPDAAGCLASNGTAPTCSATCQTECQNAVTTFNPDVAASIVSCVTSHVSASAADTDCQAAAPNCVGAAAAASCTDDGSAATFCTTFIQSCPDAVDGGSTDQTQSDCVGLVQAMTEDGRTDLQNCVTEEQGNCADCITNLRALTLASSH